MSRSVLVPLLLPADPTAAMEAATKQYVDAHSGTGIGNVFPFMYNTSTVEAGIGTNQLRGNNATFTASTKLWVSEITVDGLDVAVGLSRIKAGFQVYVQDYTSSARYAIWNVTANALDKGTYWELTVTPASSAGTIPGGKVALQSLTTAQSSTLFSTTTTAPGLAPGSNGAGATSYLNGVGAWTVPAGGGGGGTPIGTKMTALTALTGAGAATTDIVEVVDISDTTMAASGTNKKMTLAELVTWTTANGAVPSARTISTTAPLSGGGALSGNLTLSIPNDSLTNTQLATMATQTLKGNATGSTAGPTDLSVYAVQGMLRRAVINNTGTSINPVLATHENTMVTMSNASAQTITLPNDATSNFPIGSEIDFLWLGVGQPSFTATNTVSEASMLKIRARYTAVTAKKIAASTWVLLGALAA